MGIVTITRLAKLLAGLSAGLLLGACSVAGLPSFAPMKATKPRVVATAPATASVARDAQPYEPLAFAAAPAHTGNINGLVSKYSSIYGVPESLIHRLKIG